MTTKPAHNRQLKDLLVVFDRLAGLFEQHRVLLTQKLSSMRSADQRELRRLAQVEEALLKRLREQNGLRTQLMVYIGKSLGMNEQAARAATVTEFSARLAEPFRSRIPIEAKRLRTLVEEVRRLNTRIETVARQVLANLRDVFDAVATADRDTGSYTCAGTLRTTPPRAMFETAG